MRTSHKLTRRSFMASVAGGVVASGGAVAMVTGTAAAQNVRYTGVTDCDSGTQHDRPGYGTGVRSQHTDSDTGPGADARCHGRGPAREEGGQSGEGRYGDPVTGCSDSDSGTGADPGGRGVRCNGERPMFPRNNNPTSTRHCTDSDRGNNADPVGQGVRC